MFYKFNIKQNSDIMQSWNILFLLVIAISQSHANLPPVFTQVMNDLALSEGTPVGTVVYTLAGYDPEGSNVTFNVIGTDHFKVDPVTGNVTVVKPLDYEQEEVLKFLVSIKDKLNDSYSINIDNDVQVPVSVIVLDENDNPPVFQNVPYEIEVLENSPIGITIFDKIVVTDVDTVGETLDINCVSELEGGDICQKFLFQIIESNQNLLKANLILNATLNYNKRTIYHFKVQANDGTHSSNTTFEIRIKDVQNKPPIFYGSLSAVVDEDSPIGTMVLKIQARDGDTGEPRKIVYDLLKNPMDYFLLDYKTGELRTAKPLDKEALSDATGLIKLLIRAREVVDGVPETTNMTTATTEASITIRDVNDSPPLFNKKEYQVHILENTPPGTPLALNMNVTDKDVGINSIFSLRLNDVSGAFEVEPKLVRGYSQVNIRVANESLDYENPNQRKFIILVIAEETNTENKLSSTATVTISVIDANDNKPVFEQDSYLALVSEDAEYGHPITTITAKDMDSGSYGSAGIRYSLSGTGSELFNVNETTGAITLANCNLLKNVVDRKKRQHNEVNRINNFNVTTNGETGLISIEINTESGLEYLVATPDDNNLENKFVSSTTTTSNKKCLDYETETVYFLSYKATDDDGKGQSAVVSLKISVLDSNDSPPVCESPFYRASVDEGVYTFDSPLIIKARDVDTISDISYRIIGNEVINNLFNIDNKSGQITIRPNATVDVTHLKTDNLFFNVEASDGLFSTNCLVNITIRDVNNHAPQFLNKIYSASIMENSEIGVFVDQLQAEDLDSGINAIIKYRFQQGSFDDFRIDENTGKIFVSNKLDYDRRNTYQIEVLATDSGTPSLSGTTTLTVLITNSNDKDPYFTPKTQRAEVREDTPIGTVVHTLVALDPDVASFNSLEFAATEPITAVNEDGNEIKDVERFRDTFSINRDGKVTVNKKLDRKDYAVIQYTVLVTDSTAPTIQQGKGNLIISIVDVNEIPPKFLPPWTTDDPTIKLQIMEEQPIGTVLTTLQANDQESPIGEYNISSPYFEINKSTGVIKTISRIDYESIKEIKFMATVTDTGIPQLTSTAEIIVNVLNINDNEPYFEQNEFNFNITENSPKGTVVGKVEAKDNDLGSFGEITYSLIGENSKYFLIDSYTGSIVVANSSILDHEESSRITLSVLAIDKAANTQQKSATAKIFVNVLDINDNEPIFLQNEYSSKVADNAPLDPPAALLQVKANDLDDGVFGEIRYFFKTGNEENLFKLDPLSGIIYPLQSLQGKKGNYSLLVEARDNQGSGPHMSTANVNIEIQGINQFRPYFLIPSSSNSTVEIPGDSISTNYLIMTIRAVDNDTGDNGKLSYYLQVNNENVQENDNFIIDKITGELRTKTELQRKINSKYNLILVARDQGSPTEFEVLRLLTVILIDGNENRPEFPESMNPYKISINENSGRDVRIGKVQAVTKSKQLKEIYYYMLLGNEDGAFYLDKTNGDIFTNKSLDRETTDYFMLYILASSKKDLHISETERASFSIKTLDRDASIAKVGVTVLDVNDNEPIFERSIYYAGINAKSTINGFVAIVNATDKDYGENSKIEYIIATTTLYKLGSTKLAGSLVPSPFTISSDGKIKTAAFVAEYNQDRFELDVLAKETQPPQRYSKAKVYIWIFESSQLVRVILSRSPSEVYKEQDNIVSELRNATQHNIIVDDIRYHVDSVGRIRMDWCDLFFHAVDQNSQQIVPVDDILKIIDANYDYLRDYYAGFAIENVVPAHIITVQEEFDLALAGLAALIIVLFVGIISFFVLCCCLKHWNLTIPMERKRKEKALIKKQIIEDLNTTENPLWIEQKLKLYEEQELTMQVFSEPEPMSNSDPIPTLLQRKDSFENINPIDNTYATIQPRNDGQISEIADYATLRNNRVPSTYEFTGSTFQAPIREQDDVVAELI